LQLFYRRPCLITPTEEKQNDFFDIDEYDFYARYRMTKHVMNAILMRIENEIRFRTDRNKAMTPLQQFLITLRFYATGTFQIVSGDLADVRKSSACKAVLRGKLIWTEFRCDRFNFQEYTRPKGRLQCSHNTENNKLGARPC
jgi:hypothetical protein